MKKIFLLLLLGAFSLMKAQDCDLTITQAQDSPEVKSTRDYLMYERVFGGTSTFMFFSLSNSGGVPILNFQLLEKSDGFTKIYCLDKTSKIHIQLINGKIVTLICASENQCSGLMYDDTDKKNIRILMANFLFVKGSLEELESSPISFIRIKYAADSADYTIKKELHSEALGGDYYPEEYFRKYLKCIK